MIKVSDIGSRVHPSSSYEDRATIEQYIDGLIEDHVAAGRPWPLRVPIAWAGWRMDDIEAVLDRYRAPEAGWIVLPGGPGAM